jgi:hypothetical protein
LARGGHTPHVLEKAFSWHERFKNTGSMLPKRAGGVTNLNIHA